MPQVVPSLFEGGSREASEYYELSMLLGMSMLEALKIEKALGPDGTDNVEAVKENAKKYRVEMEWSVSPVFPLIRIVNKQK
jgi:hypothetical protein